VGFLGEGNQEKLERVFATLHNILYWKKMCDLPRKEKEL